MKMEELLLPEAVRHKAAVSDGGEHAWRQQDVDDVLQEARAAGLACLGGQVQFQTPEGIAEAYWLNFDPQPQLERETWSDYVSRSSDEALEGFRRLCRDADFRSVARDWEFIATKMDREAYRSDCRFVVRSVLRNRIDRPQPVMPPYNEQFPVATRVQIASKEQLEEFRRSWRYHHPLTVEQLAFAGRPAIVEKVAFYHGGDVLYTLNGIPGMWHEQCLANSD